MAQVPVTENFRVLPDTGIGARWDASVKPVDITKNAKGIIAGLDNFAAEAMRLDEDHLKDIANQVMDYRSKAMQDYQQKKNKYALEDAEGNNMLDTVNADEAAFRENLYSDSDLSNSQRHRVNDMLASSTRAWNYDGQNHYNQQRKSQRGLDYESGFQHRARIFVNNYRGGLFDGGNVDKANEALSEILQNGVDYYSEDMSPEDAFVRASKDVSAMIAGAIKTMSEEDPERAERMRNDFKDILDWSHLEDVNSTISKVMNADLGDKLGDVMANGGTFTMNGTEGSDGSHYVSKGNASIKGAPPGMLVAAQTAAKILGVPAEYLMTQFAVETSDGKGGWSRRASFNNFGAVKGKNGYISTTNEVKNGKTVKEKASWAGFSTPEEFGRYYAGFVRKTYPDALKARNPYEYFQALQHGRGGKKYASDPKYAEKMSGSFNTYFKSGGGYNGGAGAGISIKVPKFENMEQAQQWLQTSGLPRSIWGGALQRFHLTLQSREDARNAENARKMASIAEKRAMIDLDGAKLTASQMSDRYGGNLTDDQKERLDRAMHYDPAQKRELADTWFNNEAWLKNAPPEEIFIAAAGNKDLYNEGMARKKALTDPNAASLNYSMYKKSGIDAEIMRQMGVKSRRQLENDDDLMRKYTKIKSSLEGANKLHLRINKRFMSSREMIERIPYVIADVEEEDGGSWFGF